MEVRTHLAVDAFGNIDFTVFRPVLAIGPHAGPVGNVAWVPRRPGQPNPSLDITVREIERAVRAHQASGVQAISCAAMLGLADKSQAKRPAAFGNLSGIVT